MKRATSIGVLFFFFLTPVAVRAAKIGAYRIPITPTEILAPGNDFPALIVSPSGVNWKWIKTFVEIREENGRTFCYLPLSKPPGAVRIFVDPGNRFPLQELPVRGEVVPVVLPNPRFKKSAYAGIGEDLEDQFPRGPSKKMWVVREVLTFAGPASMLFAGGGAVRIISGVTMAIMAASQTAQYAADKKVEHKEKGLLAEWQALRDNREQLNTVQLERHKNNAQIIGLTQQSQASQ